MDFYSLKQFSLISDSFDDPLKEQLEDPLDEPLDDQLEDQLDEPL